MNETNEESVFSKMSLAEAEDVYRKLYEDMINAFRNGRLTNIILRQTDRVILGVQGEMALYTNDDNEIPEGDYIKRCLIGNEYTSYGIIFLWYVLGRLEKFITGENLGTYPECREFDKHISEEIARVIRENDDVILAYEDNGEEDKIRKHYFSMQENKYCYIPRNNEYIKTSDDIAAFKKQLNKVVKNIVYQKINDIMTLSIKEEVNDDGILHTFNEKVFVLIGSLSEIKDKVQAYKDISWVNYDIYNCLCFRKDSRKREMKRENNIYGINTNNSHIIRDVFDEIILSKSFMDKVVERLEITYDVTHMYLHSNFIYGDFCKSKNGEFMVKMKSKNIIPCDSDTKMFLVGYQI